MNLPRPFPLALGPTPLHRATGLEEVLGAGPIWLKRDDLTGLGVAGNKARPLGYLIGDALAHDADVFVAVGSPHSNFCAAAALAARVAGLDCEIVHSGVRPERPPTTMLLSEAVGARLRFAPGAARAELDELGRARADELRAAGHRPYAVPRGGATAVGGLGFAFAAEELAQQCVTAGIREGTIVIPTGSCGTQAGLLAGRSRSSLPLRVVGASVSRPAQEARLRVQQLAGECARLLGVTEPAGCDIQVRDALGDGFGVMSAADRESARIALNTTGLLLDETYGAKAMTVLRSLVVEGAGPFVFWCTGGVPSALHALKEAS